MGTFQTLGKFTDDELHAELKRRTEERLAQIERVRAEKVRTFTGLVNNNGGILQVLNLLLPDHSRNTCQEDKFMSHVNVDRCTRCTFNWLMEQQDYDEIIARFQLTSH